MPFFPLHHLKHSVFLCSWKTRSEESGVELLTQISSTQWRQGWWWWWRGGGNLTVASWTCRDTLFKLFVTLSVLFSGVPDIFSFRTGLFPNLVWVSVPGLAPVFTRSPWNHPGVYGIPDFICSLLFYPPSTRCKEAGSYCKDASYAHTWCKNHLLF